jgi:hypothetical protein
LRCCIVVYALFPRPESALEHFEVFQDNWLVGPLTLDLLGMIAYLLFIPFIFALYIVLRRSNEAISAAATALFFVGISTFFATNTAFSVLALSDQYAAATTVEERDMFLARGQAMFTLFNEGAFLVSYVIVSAAWAMIAGVMLQSDSFSRITAFSGIGAGAAGILAALLEHVSGPEVLLTIAISIYFVAIVFLFVWVILTGLRLYQLGTTSVVAEQEPSTKTIPGGDQ